jgi:hypothetical protein
MIPGGKRIGNCTEVFFTDRKALLMNQNPKTGRVSIVIPVFNEPALPDVVREVCEKMDRLGRPYEVLVIDDASTEDCTSGLEDNPKVRVERQPVNRGYGASLKEGIGLASGETVITFDGDGQHRAGDLGRFLEQMDLGAEAVLGTRQKRIHSHLWRMPGKWLLKGLARYLSGRRIRDINCGFRAFQTDVIRRYLPVCCDRFSFSTTSALALLLDNRKVVSLDLDVEKRQGRSTVAPRDGLAALLSVIQVIMLFAPLRVLLPPSVLLTTLGTILLAMDLIRLDITQGTILLLTNGLLFFFFGLLGDQIAVLRRRLLLTSSVEPKPGIHDVSRGHVDGRAPESARQGRLGQSGGNRLGEHLSELPDEEADIDPFAAAGPSDNTSSAQRGKPRQ